MWDLMLYEGFNKVTLGFIGLVQVFFGLYRVIVRLLWVLEGLYSGFTLHKRFIRMF